MIRGIPAWAAAALVAILLAVAPACSDLAGSNRQPTKPASPGTAHLVVSKHKHEHKRKRGHPHWRDIPGTTSWVSAARDTYRWARRPSWRIKRIVIHVAQGTARGTVRWFRRGRAHASANYVVTARGHVIHMVPDRSVAWHAGNSQTNATSIGVEHAGYVKRRASFTEPMYRASARLVARLAKRYGVRIDRRHIIGHNEVPDPFHHGRWGGFDHHTDPGPYWNWAKYMRYVRLYASPRTAGLPIAPVATDDTVPVQPPVKVRHHAKHKHERQRHEHGGKPKHGHSAREPILGRSRATASQARAWARAHGATRRFQKLARLYWRFAPARHVRADVAYAQAAKETGFGRFGGVLDASFHNPCGLKKAHGGSDHKRSAHKRFRSWRQGVIAHLDHLALYAAAPSYPRARTPDPRQFRSLRGDARTVQALGARWAPSPRYGRSLARLVASLDRRAAAQLRRLAGSAG